MNPDHKILLFGGTTEGRQAAGQLSRMGYEVTVCVATSTGEAFLKNIPGLRVLTGRKDQEQMAEVMRGGYRCCIDATHPYAVMATSEIRSACEKTGVVYYRLLRKEVSQEELEKAVSEKAYSFSGTDRDWRMEYKEGILSRMNIVTVGSAQEACSLLKERSAQSHLARSGKMEALCRNILLTTGAMEAVCFAPLLRVDEMNLFLRVLPVSHSFELCAEAGFSPEMVISGWGPYTTEENVRVIRAHAIDTLVTKDGGIEGGYPEKLAAALLCNVRVVVIKRPKEAGLSEEELLERLAAD